METLTPTESTIECPWRDCGEPLQYLSSVKETCKDSRELVIDYGCTRCRHVYVMVVHQRGNEPALILWRSREPWSDWDWEPVKRPVLDDQDSGGLIEELFK